MPSRRRTASVGKFGLKQEVMENLHRSLARLNYGAAGIEWLVNRSTTVAPKQASLAPAGQSPRLHRAAHPARASWKAKQSERELIEVWANKIEDAAEDDDAPHA
jgi:hypothetical protein